MTERVQQLEKELAELKSEIAAMKSTSPTAPATTASAPVPTSSLVAGSAPTADTAKPSTLASILGPTSLSGFVDLYYGQNFNNPATRQNGLQFFNGATNQFGLNLIELVVDKTPDASNSRTGYHLAFGYGQAMNAIYGASTTSTLSADQYVKEAYFSYLAPVGKGLQFDVGKFVTPAGEEVIETKDNYNYSRGILFSYAIPYYHFGMRAKYAFNDKYSLTGYFVNGWNNVIDNNTGKTYGASFGWTPNKKFSLTQNYLAGPEQNNYNTDWRQLSDTVVTINATKRLTLIGNYDYGFGDHMPGVLRTVYWTGVAGYFKYALSDKYSFSSRYEYYNDHYGFTTGTAGHIQEITGTFEHPFATHILSRLEFRHDMANNPIFSKGASQLVKDQTTLTAGMVFLFDTREGSK
ncbi:MAG: outer membrane beta-barrel protein [Terriglobales bacterium]